METMKYYNKYYVEGLESKNVSHDFLRVIAAYSEAFSLVYFRYKEDEKLKKSTSEMKKKLSPFQLKAQNVTEWPNTQILGNDGGHIYRMVTYRTDMDMIPILEEADTVYDWDYPQYPMDPCFYKDGYAWFVVTSHEYFSILYLGEEGSFPLISDLEGVGVTLIPQGRVAETELLYNLRTWTQLMLRRYN